MDKLTVDLENCYGIKKFQREFDFTDSKRAYAVYASNGLMKTSFADTFSDLANGKPTIDRYFGEARPSKRSIKDEAGTELSPTNIVVIPPFSADVAITEETSVLLINETLKNEYLQLRSEIEAPQAALLKALSTKSGLKKEKEIEKELSFAVTGAEDRFYVALIQLRGVVERQTGAPFGAVPYNVVLNNTVLEFLSRPAVRENLQDYVLRYNDLISRSQYFKQGMFEYHNANTIADQLDKQGFFKAKHSVVLNSANATETITDKARLVTLIQEEQDAITNDAQLKSKFAALAKESTKNETLRAFREYAMANTGILPHLLNPTAFKQDVWRSYLKDNFALFEEFMQKYDSIEKRKSEVEAEARKDTTKWEEVIADFNDRFIVPFELVPTNKAAVVLTQEPVLKLGFIFKDADGTKEVDPNLLQKGLSQGERKAFYVLNILFNVTARREKGMETLFIVDDVADSFDYKNKHAIIEYLKEIADVSFFRLLILTHNFDFFRTLECRGVVKRDHCLTAFKHSTGITLEKTDGLRNLFVKHWKIHFTDNNKIRIGCIAFMRNLIEFEYGEDRPEFAKLTSLLHYKDDSETILQEDLDSIYKTLFQENATAYPNPKQKVLDMVFAEAEVCLDTPAGINLENKVVLAIATRILADKYMLTKMKDISSADFESNQTARLFEEFSRRFAANKATVRTLRRVVLMTPESIHLNSFMYEPILDMSDDHLRNLYRDVKQLK